MKRRMALLALLISLLSWVLVVGSASAQTNDPPPQINTALADLGTRLGQPITLSSLDAWEFSVNLYTDTALGCALSAGTPRPEGISAYTFRLTYQGVLYDYRIAQDGSIVIPCDAALLQVTPAAPIAVTTIPCPADFEGFLNSRLRVTMRAQVDATSGAVRLRNAPSTGAEQILLIQPLQPFDIIGGPGCADGFVWYQVSINGTVGWVAEGAPPDNYFLEPVLPTVIAPTVAVTTVVVTAVPVTRAPTVPADSLLTPVPVGATPLQLEPTEEATAPVTVGLPELAAVSGDSLGLFNINPDGTLATRASIPGVGAEVGPAIDDITWSPDGQVLAYTLLDPDFSASLYVTDTTGSEPVLLATDLYYLMPVTFTPDSTQVIYAKVSTEPQTTQDQTVNVFRQALAANATAELIGTFAFGTGCGGGSPFPGDSVYQWEAGYSGNALILELTPTGLLHSTNCTGSGTVLMNLETGESVEVGTNLARVDVSPEGMRAAGLSMGDNPTIGTLTVVDLGTLAVTPLGAVAQPDQLAWGPDGNIYYSARTPSGAVVPGTDVETFINMGFEGGLPVNTVSIHKVDLAATTDSEIYTGDAYAIGRLFVAPDNQWLYFSQIPNGEAWAQAILDGTITAQSPASASFDLFAPSLNRLSLSGGNTELVGANLVKATLNDAAYLVGATG